MTNTEDKLTGLSPKCLTGLNRFIGANGHLYPCCFVYTNFKDLNEWAEKYGQDKSEIDLNIHSHDEVISSNFMKKLYENFDMPVCRRYCSSTSYDTKGQNKPLWDEYDEQSK